jgi:hypothetical protein
MTEQLRELLAELEPVAGRWRRAARVGLITALGAGAMAAMQVTNPLGLTLVLNFALPEAAFTLARGGAFVCCAAVCQMLGLALVGALVDSPVVHVTVFVLICLCSTYWIYEVLTLGRLWVWIQVPAPRQMALRQQEPVVAGMLYQSAAGFHQPLLQAGQRPVTDLLGQRGNFESRTGILSADQGIFTADQGNRERRPAPISCGFRCG